MFNALLLAAGLSSRLGLIKQELKTMEMTILERSLKILLRAPLKEILLITGPYDFTLSFEDKRVKLLYNREYLTGMGSSIRRGVQGLENNDLPLLIHLSDKPLLKEETLFSLIKYYYHVKPSVLYPVFKGVRGHPVIFHQDLMTSLLSLKGKEGGRNILEHLREEEIVSLPVEDPGVIFDVDTWEDYLSLLIYEGFYKKTDSKK